MALGHPLDALPFSAYHTGMDLGLNIEKLMGEPVAAAQVTVLKALSRDDLEALDAPAAIGNYQPAKISERHHALARAIASGMKDLEAAALVGYSKQMVVILRQSPAFLELIELYSREVDLEFSELTAQFAGLTKDAIGTLRDRLEQNPEDFSNKMLLEIGTKMGDRAGFAPVQRSEATVNVSLSEKLATARRRVEAALIEMTAKDVTPE